MTEEHRIQNEIMAACSEYAILFRVNVVRGQSRDGRYISSGVPAGYSDLSGVRFSDGKAVFIEVKKPTGRVSKEQKNFLHQMQKAGAVAGVCRSAEEAVELLRCSEMESVYRVVSDRVEEIEALVQHHSRAIEKYCESDDSQLKEMVRHFTETNADMEKEKQQLLDFLCRSRKDGNEIGKSKKQHE